MPLYEAAPFPEKVQGLVRGTGLETMGKCA
jgi:hypothetical protein